MFFLYHRASRPTGKIVAEALGLPHGKRIIRFDTDVLLRWGSQVQSELEFRWAHVINTAQALANASNKLEAFYRMRGDEAIRVPWFTHTHGDAEQKRREGMTILGRTKRGARGRGIVAYPPDAPFMAQHELYTQFIPNDREYRLHVVGDEVVRVQRKYLDHPEQRHNEYVKNYANGYRFKAPQKRLNADREVAAVKAIQAMRLDFGCVDMVIDPANQAWVLEVNTAPACSPLTAAAYIGRLAPMIEAKIGRPLNVDYEALNILAGGEDRDTEEP